MRPSALLELMNSLVRTGIAAPAAIRSRSWAAEYSERKVKTENTTSASRFITAPPQRQVLPTCPTAFQQPEQPGNPVSNIRRICDSFARIHLHGLQQLRVAIPHDGVRACETHRDGDGIR